MRTLTLLIIAITMACNAATISLRDGMEDGEIPGENKSEDPNPISRHFILKAVKDLMTKHALSFGQ